MLSSEEILERATRDYRRSSQHSARWRTEATEDYDFVAGEQWSEADRARLESMGRVAMEFNRIAPMVNAVIGTEVNNRQEVRFLPREQGDVKVSEILTSAAEYLRDCCDAEDEESDAFYDAVVCGMGWTETRLDFDRNPDGDLKISRVDPFEMYWDTNASKRNLVDAKYVFRIKDMDREDAEAAFGRETVEMSGSGERWGGPQDAEPEYDAPGDEYDNASPANRDRIGKVRVVEYQFRHRSRIYQVYEQGNATEYDEGEFKRLSGRLEKLGMPLVEDRDYVTRTGSVVYRAYIVGSVVARVNPAPDPHRFTYHCITGYRDRNDQVWYGLVRPMKDPQRWANSYLSLLHHTISTNAKGGLIAEEGVTDDHRKFEENWASPDGVTWINDGGLGRVQPKPAPQIPAAIGTLLDFSISSLRDVSGVNLEMLGMADREQAGITEMHRKRAGMTIIASLFDSLRRYRKEQGRLLLTFITQHLADNRLVRVVGKEGEQYVPLTRQDGLAEYDVIVDEAPSSPNQKEATFAIISQMLPMLGNMVTPEVVMTLLEYSPLPSAVIEKLRDLNQGDGQQEQAQQAQQAAMKLEMDQKQADVEKTRADTQLAEVKALVERIEAGLSAAKGVQEIINKPQMEGASVNRDAGYGAVRPGL